jgi:hypothetical protein
VRVGRTTLAALAASALAATTALGATWSPERRFAPAGSGQVPQAVALIDTGDAVVGLAFRPAADGTAIPAVRTRRGARGAWRPLVRLGPRSAGVAIAGVGLNTGGDAVAVWRAAGGLFASRRSPGGAWGPSVQIAPGSIGAAAVRMDDLGTARAVWATDEGATGWRVRVARQDRGGAWTTLPATVAMASAPALDMDVAGDAVAAWLLDAPPRVLATRRLTNDAAWETSATVSTPSDAPLVPAVAIGSRGDAAVGWASRGFAAARVAARPRLSGGWGAPEDPLAGLGTPLRSSPVVAVDGQGDIAAAFAATAADGSGQALAAIRPAGTVTWQTSARLGALPTGAGSIAARLAAGGAEVVGVADRHDARGLAFTTVSTGGATVPWQATRFPSLRPAATPPPLIAVAPGGHAIAVSADLRVVDFDDFATVSAPRLLIGRVAPGRSGARLLTARLTRPAVVTGSVTGARGGRVLKAIALRLRKGPVAVPLGRLAAGSYLLSLDVCDTALGCSAATAALRVTG